MAADMREIGSTGLKRSGGYVYEEFLKAWQGPQRYRTIAEMLQDPIICSAMLAIELSLRQVAKEVKPADDSPEADEVKQFIDGCLDDMSSPWADTLAEILTMLAYGFTPDEVCYKRRIGYSNDNGKSSKFDDGKVGWRKWAIRSADSLYKWEFDDEGGLAGMWQYRWGTQDGPVFIPIEKMLLFRASVHKNNPEGRSILRGAYDAYYYKRNISRIEAIGVERDLAGLPVIYAPANYLSATATADEKAFFELLKTIVTNIRRDEQEGVIMPMLYDDDGNKMFELTLLASGGTRSFDTDAIIARYDQRITMTMLADFIMLGHEAVGSYALSATKASMFKTALEAWLQAIADVINTHAIPKLLRLNGIDVTLAPKLTFGHVGEIELADVVAWIQQYAAAGGQLFPSLETENYLRGLVGVPQLDEEEYTEREAKAQAEKDQSVAIRREAINAKGQSKGQQGAQYSREEAIAILDAAEMKVALG